jgi:hypothetical protein
MAKEDETPGANPAEIENLIKQIRGTNLEPGAKEKIECENSVNRIDIAVISRRLKCQKPNSFASRHRELAIDASSAIHLATTPAKAKAEETFDR